MPERRGSALFVSAASLGNPAWPELLAAASQAGFDGLSVWPAPTWGRARAEGWRDADLRRSLDDHGLTVLDVDAHVVWAGPGDPGGPYFEEASLDDIVAAAHALGARSCNVLVTGRRGASVDDGVVALAGACARLAPHGLAVTVEFAPGTAVGDLATAAEVVRRVRAEHGHEAAVLLDVWHHRGRVPAGTPVDPADARTVAVVQLDDVPAEPYDRARANRHGRLPPGEGAGDVRGVVAELRAAGAAPAWVVEVFHDALLGELGPAGFARRLADAARAVIAAQ